MKVFRVFLSVVGFIQLIVLLANVFLVHGIPLMHADLPGIWDEYYDVIEWHEIGAPDPRYQDPCGPGTHEGNLGEPGCR